MSTSRKKILWITSWYPNKFDRYDGDFIQRHAHAAAINNDIHVIFVKEADIEDEKKEEWNKHNGLTEQIIYYRKAVGLFKKAKKQLTWYFLLLRAVDIYIESNGKPYLIHVHVPWKAGIVAMQLKYRRDIKYIITEHWGIYNNILEDSFNKKPIYIKSLLRLMFKNAEHLISPSHYLAMAINESVVSKSYSVIPNAVDTSLFNVNKEKNSTFTFIHVSNMVPLKNVEGILKAFHRAVINNPSKLQLILIGNRNNEYSVLAEQLGLLDKQVFFKGEIAYSEVAQEMQLAHCLILNSNIENSPCVIGEALCCGLPVITTKVGGIPELVDETNSLFVKAKNEDHLADAMNWVYQNYNSFNLEKIAEKAQSRFCYPYIGSLHDLVYHQLQLDA